MPVYSSSTIYVYPLYSKAPVISRKAVAISDFIIASRKTPAYVKPPLDILYYYTI
jgi:hypothetical protein